MRERQNIYLFVAGILLFAYFFMPIASFNDGEVITLLNLNLFVPATGYKFYIGAIGAITLAVSIYLAIPFYRSSFWQKRFILTALIINAVLYLFVFYKYYTWLHHPVISLQQPTLRAGVAFPIVIELVLFTALSRLKKKL